MPGSPYADDWRCCAGAEVLEFPDHPFFVTSMLPPHVGALAGAPVHPLVAAFVAAGQDRGRARG